MSSRTNYMTSGTMTETLVTHRSSNVRTLLDKSVWDSLGRDEIWTLSSISAIGLPPVWYEEIRSELTPRVSRKFDPTERPSPGGTKGDKYEDVRFAYNVAVSRK